METTTKKYYPFGYSGHQYLSINNTSYIQSELLPVNLIRFIKCDIKEKWMKVWSFSGKSTKWDELDVANLRRGDTIDLNENGERWEGDSLNGSPFGYGCIYNSENQLVYSGFMFEGLKVCYGKEMYGDVGLVEYEGGFYNGMRYGDGKLCNKKNELIYEGEWYMNNPVELSSIKIEKELKEEDIHFGIEELVIGENCGNDLIYFHLIGFGYLKKLRVKKNSLKNLESLVISNNNELESIGIEDGDWNTASFKNVKSVKIKGMFKKIRV